MRLKICLAILALAAAAGCAGARRSELPPPAEIRPSALWAASLDVVGSRFEIESAERASGEIRTAWLVGSLSRTGFVTNSASSAAGAYSLFHTVRRRARVTLAPGGEDALEGGGALAVTVEMQRLVREHPEIIPGGTFAVGREIEGRGEEFRSRWVSIGRDHGLEERMREEIARRCRRISGRDGGPAS